MVSCSNCRPSEDKKIPAPQAEDGLKNVPILLTWVNYDGFNNSRPEDAIVYFRNHFVGTGKAGFNVVLAELATLPKCSAIVIAYNPQSKKVRPGYKIPYELLGLGSEFERITSERQLKVIPIAFWP